MRIAVADDGALFREGLSLLLQMAGHDVVGSVADGDALLELAGQENLDAAIIDIKMPPGEEGGLTSAGRMRSGHPTVALLMLSHYAEAHYLMRILEIGTQSVGYRLKDRVANLSTLSDTLHRICAGEIVIEPEVAARLVGQRQQENNELDALQGRELQVLGLMAEGLSNTSIATALFVSTKAVEKHIANIFSKLALPHDATNYHRRVLAVVAYLRVRPTETEL